MAKFSVGTIVDLYDFGFRQWRGEYIVIKIPEGDRPLYKIRNVRTNAQQWVKETALRIGRLGPFRIESLQP
jgi:hypothetical protein